MKKIPLPNELKQDPINSISFFTLSTLAVVTLASVFSIACGNNNKKSSDGGAGGSTKKETENGSGSSGSGDGTKADEGLEGFLTESDFSSEKGALTKEQVKMILEDKLDNAVTNFDDDEEKEEDPIECVEKIRESFKVDSQKISTDLPLTKCEVPVPGSDKSMRMTVKVKGFSICSKKNAFDKANRKNSADSFVLCTESELKSLLNSKMSLDFEGNIEKHWSAKMTSNGEPCVFSISKNEIEIGDGCLSYERIEGSLAKDRPDVSVRGTYKSVKGGLKNKYWTGGFLDVSINTWKGSIKFGKGEPQYSLTSSKGEKISGSWKDLKKK